jgi:hypothetical protein
MAFIAIDLDKRSLGLSEMVFCHVDQDRWIGLNQPLPNLCMRYLEIWIIRLASFDIMIALSSDELKVAFRAAIQELAFGNLMTDPTDCKLMINRLSKLSDM